MARGLHEGDPAPDFELADQDDRTVRLSDHHGGPVVLYFYPRDFTPGCTAEACQFRDEFEAFRGLDSTVLGASADPPRTHKKFAERHGLPFTLLSDPDHAVRNRYVGRGPLGLVPGRVTFVIDADGIIRRRIESRTRPGKHIRDALEALASAESPGPTAQPT